MMFFEFTFTPDKNDHPVKGAPSLTGYVQAETSELAKSEARRQLREELDPENCMCYRPVRLKEIPMEDWQRARSQGLSPKSVDNYTNILGEHPAKSDGSLKSGLVKKQSEKDLYSPEMLLPVHGSIESGCDYDHSSSVSALNERLSSIRHGESLVIHGLSLHSYHACEGYSGSQIALVHTGGLAALEWYKHAPRDVLEPVTLSVIAAVRAAIFDPVQFAADYAATGDMILSEDDYRKILLMRDSALANPVLATLLQRGVASLSIFYRTRSGVLLKVRPDWIGELDGVAYLLHVKATDDSYDFGEMVERRGYHIRAALYNFVTGMVFGIEPEFAFCTISCRKRSGRHLVEMRTLDEEDAMEGIIQSQSIITSLEAMQRDGVSSGMGTVRRPFWARLADKQRRDGRSPEVTSDDV